MTMPKGGFKTPPNPMHHPCVLPPFEFGDAGRPWECPDCGCEWILHRDAYPLDKQLEDLQRDVERDNQRFLSTPVPAVVTRAEVEVQHAQEVQNANDPGFYEPLAEPGDGSITKVADHSASCAFRLGTGMCSCPMREKV